MGCARNEEKLKSVAEQANNEGPGKMYPVKCDVSKEEDITDLFGFVKEEFGEMHVMVNNAAQICQAPLLSGDAKVISFVCLSCKC